MIYINRVSEEYGRLRNGLNIFGPGSGTRFSVIVHWLLRDEAFRCGVRVRKRNTLAKGNCLPLIVWRKPQVVKVAHV